jgi:hypothetical protein
MMPMMVGMWVVHQLFLQAHRASGSQCGRCSKMVGLP